MDVSAAIRARRSIRKYQKGARIPEAHIEAMLEAAMMAPSAKGRRPWTFIVVESEALKSALVAVHPYCSSLVDASLAIIVCGPEDPEAENTRFWQQDCAAAAENLLLEAAGLGYGTCWCGLYPAAERAAAVKTVLSASGTPLALIIVGVPAEAPAARGYFDPAKVRYLK